MAAVEESQALLDLDQQEKLDAMVADIHEITTQATSKPIASVQEEAQTVELIGRGVIALKELDSLRRRLTDPLNAQVKRINALFHVVTDPCEALVGKGGKLEKLELAWRSQERARIAREQAEALRAQQEAAEREAKALAMLAGAADTAERLEAMCAAETASQEQTQAALAAPEDMRRGLRTDSASVTEREVWTFTVADAALVPRSFLVPDLAAIRAAVAAGVRSIAGVSIEQEARLTRRVG